VESQGGGVLGPLAGVLEDLCGGGGAPNIHRGLLSGMIWLGCGLIIQDWKGSVKVFGEIDWKVFGRGEKRRG
jgi:hypothetical protein